MRLLALVLALATGLGSQAAAQELDEAFWADVEAQLEDLSSVDVEAVETAAVELCDLVANAAAAIGAGAPFEENGPRLLATVSQLMVLPPGPWSGVLEDAKLAELARDLADRTTDPNFRAEVELRVAVALADRGELAEADAALRRAVATYGPRAYAPLPRILALRADIARMREDWDRAFSLLGGDRVVETGFEVRDPNAWESLAFLDRVAREYTRPDVAAFERQSRCEVLGVEGQVWLEYGLVERADQAFDDAQRLAEGLWEESGQEDPAAHGLLRATQIRRTDQYFLTDRQREVVQLARASLEDPRLGPDHRASMRSQLGLALAWLELKDPDREPEAAEVLELALEDPFLREAPRLSIAHTLAQLEIFHEGWESAEYHLETAAEILDGWRQSEHLPFVDRLAFQHSLETRLVQERGRAALEQSLARLQESARSFREQWRRTALHPGGVNFLRATHRRSIIGELVRGELALRPGRPEVAFESLLEAQALGSLAREEGIAAPDLEAVRERLLSEDAGDAGLLVYLPEPLLTHVFAVDRHRVVPAEVAGEFELAGLLEKWQVAVTDPSTGLRAIQKISAELAGHLLPADINAALQKWDRVWIVGAPLLADLAFETLPVEGKPLGLRLPVAYLPSVPVGVWLAERPPAATPSGDDLELALWAAPTQSEAASRRWQPSLQIAAAELERLAAPFQRTLSIRGKGATIDGLRQPSIARARLLHILCHGVFASERLQAAGLALAPRDKQDLGVLWYDEIRSLVVPRTVVLSACNAATGYERFGEDGVSHLAGAFLQAGADTVVLARRELGLESTLALMEVFHRELAGGADAATALHKARIELAKRRSTRHPFHHSLIHVVGLGDR